MIIHYVCVTKDSVIIVNKNAPPFIHHLLCCYFSEYDRTNQLLRMVLEAGETDLSSFLKARGTGLPPALVLHYWEEMLHAVHYIHEHGI